MAHFCGTLQGSRGEATRMGTKDSGIETYAASWEGAVRVKPFVGPDGRDWAQVELTTWARAGVEHPLYRGPVGEFAPNGEREE